MALPQITLNFMDALTSLRPLGLFVLGISVYGVFVFHFYRFLARKDIFDLDLSRHNHAKRPALRKTISVVFYMFKSLLVFPLFVFFWFLVIASLLLVMGKNQSIENVMLAAMGVVAAIRICSYYNSALSMDIAKILPFALLGIMLIDNSLLRVPQSIDTIQQAAPQLETMIYYLGAVVLMEFVLSMATAAVEFVRGVSGAEDSRRETAGLNGAAAEQVPLDVPDFISPSEPADSQELPRVPVTGLEAKVQVSAPRFMTEPPTETRVRPRPSSKEPDWSQLSPELYEVLEYVDRRSRNGSGG